MKNIYILYGENKEAIKDFKKEITKKFLSEEKNDFNYIEYDLKKDDSSEWIYECKSNSFFSQKKVVVINNPLFVESNLKKTKEEVNFLEEYIKNINKEILLIFILEVALDNRKKIVKDIKKIADIREFKNYNDNELGKYVFNYFKKNKIVISEDNINFLLFYSGLKYEEIKGELDKLLIYCFEKKTVEKEDIKRVISKSLEYDIFSLTNNLFSKNYKKLEIVLNSLKFSGEEPIFLITLIANQLRIYINVKILLKNNYNQKEIASILKIHPYRVKLAVEYVYNRDLFDLMDLIIICKEYDKRLKTSYVDKYLTFQFLVYKLCERL